MSVETVNQFYQQVMQEPALRQQFQAAPDRESLANLAVEVGQQNGYSFTTEEVKQALVAQSAASEIGELSDEQLEAVAGGKRPKSSIEIYSGEAKEIKC
jgi:predicted ribosomally synthesized peptide with nif11-like leader